MRAETFLADLNARARHAGGLTVHVLAQATAEALEAISEAPKTRGSGAATAKSSTPKTGSTP